MKDLDNQINILLKERLVFESDFDGELGGTITSYYKSQLGSKINKLIKTARREFIKEIKDKATHHDASPDEGIGSLRFYTIEEKDLNKILL